MWQLQQSVETVDVAALLRAVDGLCASRQWDELADLARRCREAVERGKQLWPVATHIDYRLALEGPASHAAAVLRPGAGRFALGPLTEVAASTHDFESLAPYLADPISASAVVQERVLRGEDLQRPGVTPTELPNRMLGWEPTYALPTYSDRQALFPQPDVATRPLGSPRRMTTGRSLAENGAESGVRALRAVAEVWASESNGSIDAAVVEGGAEDAVGCVADHAALAEISAAEALSLLQWAGASGGAHGRRRGGAAGRFSAWWAVAALTGIEWQGDVEELGAALGGAVAELTWYRWEPVHATQGWTLRLAVVDPVDGLAWAVDARDDADG